jgi:hypothetical protein
MAKKIALSSFYFDSYSIAIDQCDPTILYLVNENAAPKLNAIRNGNHSHDFDEAHILVYDIGTNSIDTPVTHIAPYLNGSISVSENAIYCSTTTEEGVLRSTDKGKTWQSIGGPPSPVDSRLICAINSHLIFLVDTSGNVWMTENSGGVPYDKPTAPRFSADTSSTFNACDTSKLSLLIAAQPCGPVFLDTVYIDSISLSNFALTNLFGSTTINPGDVLSELITFYARQKPGKHLCKIHIKGSFGNEGEHYTFDTVISISITALPVGPDLFSEINRIKFDIIFNCDHFVDTAITLTNRGCDTLRITQGPGILPNEFKLLTPYTLPIVLPPDSSIVLTFRFIPTAKGTYITQPTFHAEQQGLSQDLSIRLEGISRLGAPLVAVNNSYLSFDTVSTCGFPIDTVITLTNHGCDTLRITQGPGNLPPEFQLLPPFQLPIILPPDSSVVVHFRFAPNKKGNYTARPSFHAEQQGLTQDISVTLEGNGIEEGGLLSYSPKQFSFASLSICAHDSSSGFITNIGCDTISVDGKYFGAIDYSTIGLNANGWGVLAPHETFTYSVYLNPSQKGIRQGYIILTSTNNIGVKKDSIPFTVIVLDGTKILSASQNTLDFGTTSLCAEKDTTFTLRNTGCDTIWVKGYGVSGVGFGVKDSSFFIPPGQSRNIDVHTVIDTTGHITSNSDQLTIQSDADNPISPITLTRSFTYPKNYTVRFAIGQPSGKNQSTVDMYIIADSLPQGLTQLSATLDIANTDLLSFTNYESPNQVTINGKQIIITGNPTITSVDTLATLHYRVFLTNDSTTTVSFSNVNFNNGDLDYANCVATVQGFGGAGYNYEFVCAEHTIAKLLRGDKLQITSISPNPTRSQITLTTQSPSKETATLLIYDLLGNQVQSQQAALSKGTTSIIVNTTTLLSGRYSVQLVTANNTVTSSFVKE